MIYGDMCDHNMSKFIRGIDRYPVFPVIDHGHNLIQPVNARDLGRAYYDVLVAPDKTSDATYDLSGKEPMQLVEVLGLIRSLLGSRARFFNVPRWLALLGARILKVISLRRVDAVERVLRMGEDRTCSHEEATLDFGYSPMSFQDGIRIEIDEYLRSRKPSNVVNRG